MHLKHIPLCTVVKKCSLEAHYHDGLVHQQDMWMSLDPAWSLLGASTGHVDESKTSLELSALRVFIIVQQHHGGHSHQGQLLVREEPSHVREEVSVQKNMEYE